MNFQEILTISKYSFKEASMLGQIEQAGSNYTSIMEKMEKNAKYIRNQTIAMKLVMTLYVSMLIFSPISAFVNSKGAADFVSFQWRLFSSGVVMNFFFLTQFFYILMFGMFFSSGLLSGEAFRWLSTLPVPKKDLRKISYMTFVRGIDAQLIALCLVFPIAAAIITQSVLITLVCFVASLLNTIFTFSILIILGSKMQRVMRLNDTRSKKAEVIRILWLIGYFVATLIAAVGFSIIDRQIQPFFYNEGLTLMQTTSWNQILPWVSFPFSIGYLIMVLYIGSAHFSSLIVAAAIIGVLLFGVICLILTRKALKILEGIVLKKSEPLNEKIEPIIVQDVRITVVSPKNAYLQRDMKMVPRDIQVIIMNIMPILFPLFGVFMGALIVGPGTDIEAQFATIGFTLFYTIFGSMMGSIGTMMVESSGVTITQSLPIVVRDQAKAKIQWISTILLISMVVPVLTMALNSNLQPIFKYMIVLWPICFLCGVANIEYSAVLFGKLKYKYVLTDKPNIRFKTLKTSTIFILNGIFAVGIIIGAIFSIMKLVFWEFALVFLGSELIVAILLCLGFNKLFPKPKSFI